MFSVNMKVFIFHHLLIPLNHCFATKENFGSFTQLHVTSCNVHHRAEFTVQYPRTVIVFVKRNRYVFVCVVVC